MDSHQPPSKILFRYRYTVGIFTCFTGAFLLWSIQPMAARLLLPLYGGSAAVWTTSLVFFQMALLLGYLCAYAVHRYGKHSRVPFVALLALAICLAFFGPRGVVSVVDVNRPTVAILVHLSILVGLPYLCLSTTASIVPPLVARDDRQAYVLFGWSNFGSILGLVAYPFVVEPLMPLSRQMHAWSLGFIVWALSLGLIFLGLGTGAQTLGLGKVRLKQHVCWIGLSALGVMLLMAVSDAIVTDLTVTPLLWILPLCLYLLSFVIAFGRPQWADQRVWIPLFWLSMIAVCYLVLNGWRVTWLGQLLGWSLVLLSGCMLVHGELVRSRPDAFGLPAYYLDLALGGVLGGLSCAVVAPNVLPLRAELHLILPVLCLVAVSSWLTSRRKMNPYASLTAEKVIGLALTTLLVGILTAQIHKRVKGHTVLKRNFYGALKVKHYNAPSKKGGIVHLLDGRISHGFQYRGESYTREATTYFAPKTGIGRLLSRSTGPRNIAIMGLGIGTMASYARRKDRFHFFEINPQVIEVAQNNFTYLKDSEGRVKIHLGDGRLMVKNWRDELFDAIVIDAFTGDAIPSHLITHQAMAIYLDKLHSNGVLAVNVSNQHADLKRVMVGHLQRMKLQGCFIRWRWPSVLGAYVSHWVIIGRDKASLNTLGFERTDWSATQPIHWTDDYSPLLPILR